MRAAEAGSLRKGRQALVELLGIFARGRGHREKFVVVFDGPAGGFPPGGSSEGVSVVFSAGRSADHVIRDRVERERDPGRVTVVSVDREVSGHARRKGCRVEAPTAFFEMLARSSSRQEREHSPLDRRSIERELRRHLENGGKK